MKRLYTLLLISCMWSSSSYAQDFCTNLPKIIDEVGFTESFQKIRGDLVSETSASYDDGVTWTRIYQTTQDLIPGVPATIVNDDYPGDLDTWTYRIDYSTTYTLKDERKVAEYWAELVKKCVKDEEGWTFTETARKYDSEEKMYVWNASKRMEGYLGLRAINVSVILFEEKDDSFRNTGRYGVRIVVL